MKCNINLRAIKKKFLAIIFFCICSISVNAQFFDLSTGIGITNSGVPDPNWIVNQVLPVAIPPAPALIIIPPIVGGDNPQYPTGGCGLWIAPPPRKLHSRKFFLHLQQFIYT
ncbi:MAG: hypothetical protein AB8B74_09685 [Crocinitomicaceae bacterium]